MFCTIYSAALHGLECTRISIEVDISKGWPGFHVVGLTDTAIQESRERIKAAWKNSNIPFPYNYKLLINLAPANVRKIGTLYDLPMAVGMYIASTKTKFNISNSLFVGELALDGTLRKIQGTLSIAQYAKENGIDNFFVPYENAEEASLVEEINVYAIKNLKAIINHIDNIQTISPYKRKTKPESKTSTHHMDMAFVKGQHFAKRALEIAAAGAHNMLLNGPPGSGKTLLARTLPSILPELTKEEALEVTKLYSVAGILPKNTSYIKERPFRSPHHSASAPALVGGGTIPRPGEISLAHRGILFLDEFLEFPRAVLEHLRQPLEDGIVTIARARGTLTFPAQFILIASQNPCPCGFATDPQKQCSCSAYEIIKYKKKLSGPLIDRIDLHVEVPRISFNKLSSTHKAEPSEAIRKRITQTRKIQSDRFKKYSYITNADIEQKDIQTFCKLNTASQNIMKQATDQMQLSARAYFRTLKVARTIADLEKSDEIKTEHLAEALQYRYRSE